MLRVLIYAAGLALPLLIGVFATQLTGMLDTILRPAPCVFEHRYKGTQTLPFLGADRTASVWTVRVVGNPQLGGPLQYVILANGGELYGARLLNADATSTHPQHGMACSANGSSSNADTRLCAHTDAEWRKCDGEIPGEIGEGVHLACRSELTLSINPVPIEGSVNIAAFTTASPAATSPPLLRGVQSGSACIFAKRNFPRWVGILFTLLSLCLGFVGASWLAAQLTSRQEENLS